MKKIEEIVTRLAQEHYMLPEDIEPLLRELHKVSNKSWDLGFQAGYQLGKEDGKETYVEHADGLREQALMYGFETAIGIAPRKAGAKKGEKRRELAYEFGRLLIKKNPDMTQTKLAREIMKESNKTNRPFGRPIPESTATRFARALKNE